MQAQTSGPQGNETARDGECRQEARRRDTAVHGKRYSEGQKREILEYAQKEGVPAAGQKYGVSENSVYEWRRARRRRGEALAQQEGIGSAPIVPIAVEEKAGEDLVRERDRKILAKWRQHPGYGPSQIRNMLRRDGFKVSVGTVRNVMEENGYLPPKIKRREPVVRYEAGRPRELYHLDFCHFHVHKQKQCLLFIEDDFSRFIPGWTLVPEERADEVIACFEGAVDRYGKPEGVMSDRGSAFHSWKGLSRFEALLESYEINYYLAKEPQANGKVEALNASFQKECLQQTEMMDLTDAVRVIGRWVDHYNHHRTHHGLGGLLVPADRFYGVAEQTLRRIEQGHGASLLESISPDNRCLEFFRVLSVGGKPQIWLMGEKILG